MYLKIQHIVRTLKQHTALNTKRYREMYSISQTKDVTPATIHQFTNLNSRNELWYVCFPSRKSNSAQNLTISSYDKINNLSWSPCIFHLCVCRRISGICDHFQICLQAYSIKAYRI